MAKYLETNEDFKSEYHLADIRMHTCFAFGEKKVFLDFSFLMGNETRPLIFDFFFFRLSEFFFYPLLARLDIGTGVEQPFGCLIVQNRQAV